MNWNPCLILLLVGVATAAGQQDRPVPTVMEDLKAELVAKKKEYRLKPAYAEEGFEKSLKEARGKEPEPPAVEVELVLTNTSDQPITIRPGHDAQILELTLEGPGAVIHERRVAMTMDYRMGEPLVIAPGKSHALPIERLAFGKRGITKYAYWTKPGTYKLSALLRLPEPNARKFVRTEPVTLKVVE